MQVALRLHALTFRTICLQHEQEGRALWRKEPPRDATFAHTPIVFRTQFGDVPLELDR